MPGHGRSTDRDCKDRAAAGTIQGLRPYNSHKCALLRPLLPLLHAAQGPASPGLPCFFMRSSCIAASPSAPQSVVEHAPEGLGLAYFLPAYLGLCAGVHLTCFGCTDCICDFPVGMAVFIGASGWPGAMHKVGRQASRPGRVGHSCCGEVHSFQIDWAEYHTFMLDWHSLEEGIYLRGFTPLAQGFGQLLLALPQALHNPLKFVVSRLSHAFCPKFQGAKPAHIYFQTCPKPLHSP